MKEEITNNGRIIEIEQDEKHPFFLTWIINNFCNNKCSYCPTELNSGKRRTFNIEDIKRFLKILLDKHPKIHCNISGGEPTLSPYFLDIVNILKENNCSASITTNGVRKIDYWEKISPMLAYVVFSYHIESKHNEDFFKKVEICSKETITSVRVMMLPNRWRECQDIYGKLFKIKNVHVEPVKIMDWYLMDKKFIEYSVRQEEWIKKNENKKKLVQRYPKNYGEEFEGTFYIFENYKKIKRGRELNGNQIINLGLNNFFGYDCQIGLKSLFVNYNGNIQRGNCKVGGIIGNLNDIDNINWPTTSIVCNKTFCHCSADVNISKKSSIDLIKKINEKNKKENLFKFLL